MVKVIFTVSGAPVAEWDRTTITEGLRILHSSENGMYQLEDGHTYEVPVVEGLYFYLQWFVSNLLFLF
jgi:hypothetical protein